jgi:CheY-like chemotaxis protein
MNGTILLIEDDEPIRQPLKELLDHEGYAVHTAVNGRDGLHVLRAVDPPDVIILDMVMPVMTGQDFLNLLRNDPRYARYRDVPVIVISAWLGRYAHETVGATNVMAKPIETEHLLFLVKRYCSSPIRKGSPQPPTTA